MSIESCNVVLVVGVGQSAENGRRCSKINMITEDYTDSFLKKRGFLELNK